MQQLLYTARRSLTSAVAGNRRNSLAAGALSLAALVGSLAVVADTASAQDALGGGNALGKDLTMQQKHRQGGGSLDANTQVGGSRVNPAAAKTDFNSRNLIVTGDVAGGRGFRGNVGYREQSEFTGKTGADDNRQWDAYGALSSPSAIRAGIDPFQATQQYGAVLYSRTYSNAAARDILTDAQPLDARLAFDRFTADAMRMKRQADIIDAANTRDTSSRTNWRQEGKLPGAGDSSGIGAASNAQTGVPVDAMLSGIGLTTYERQRLKQDVLAGRTHKDWIGQVYSENVLGSDASLADTQRLQPVLAREYTSLMDTMRARAGMVPRAGGQPDPLLAGRSPSSSTEAGVGSGVGSGTGTGTGVGGLANETPEAASQARLEADLSWLRNELSRSGPANPSAAAPGGGTGPRARSGIDGANRDGTISSDRAAAPDSKTGIGGVSEQGTEGGMAATRRNDDKGQEKKVDLNEMALVLKHGQRMDSLVPQDAGYIRDMIQLGAESMRTGDFFRAEQRFDSVLRVIPGHPTAMAGVANAQLGAGLSISSALTLRKMFAQRPEMIGTRYGPEVLPDAERIEDGLATARTRLRAAMAPDAGPNLAADRFDYGLLIAYIGFQTDNVDVTQEGLAAMRACRADDPLLRVLERVWLPEAPAPAKAEPAAATAPESAQPAPAQPAP